MNKDEKVQALLVSGSSHMTAWVDKDVKVGNIITLKDFFDPALKWMVVSVSEPKKAIEIKRGWGMTDIPRGQTPRVV